jgi:hypothetical protein
MAGTLVLDNLIRLEPADFVASRVFSDPHPLDAALF